MGIYIAPGHELVRDGGTFQELQMNTATHQILQMFGRYCTIRDHEQAPPTSKPGRHWHQVYRTPDYTE